MSFIDELKKWTHPYEDEDEEYDDFEEPSRQPVFEDRKAKVEDRPGVTRGNQWFTVPGGIDLLDTPGVLWPKFDDQGVAQRLAFTGAIRDGILDVESLAVRFLETLPSDYFPMLCERYKLTDVKGLSSYELLEAIGRRRGMLAARGEIDTERAAIMLLDEFRAAKIGRISLEIPERM